MRLVVPGDFLCYSEEFSASGNAFEDKEGKVFSTAVGCEKQSDGQRSVSVETGGGRGRVGAKRPLKAGDLVYARIEDLYDTVALTRMKPAAPGIAPNSDSAFLRISEIRRGYVESFRGNLGIGDVMVARIKEITPLGIYLTIISDDLGVVRAFCSQCRKEMIFTQKGFYCKACGAGEDRKMPAPGSQPALFAEPSSEPRGERGGGRRPFGDRGGDRGRGGMRDGPRGPPRERGFRGERGGGDRGSGDRGRGPRRDFGGGNRDRRGGGSGGGVGGSYGRDSRGPGGQRRKNIGSYYPAS